MLCKADRQNVQRKQTWAEWIRRKKIKAVAHPCGLTKASNDSIRDEAPRVTSRAQLSRKSGD